MFSERFAIYDPENLFKLLNYYGSNCYLVKVSPKTSFEKLVLLHREWLIEKFQ